MAGKEKGKLHIHINLGTLVFLVIVVYLMAYMLTYIGKDKLAIYEVSASDIVDNIEGTGVILRQENLVNAAQDGYINYYVQDGAMVNNMSKVFKLIVDESNEPVILEEDEVLEDILIRLESMSHRIDDIQYSLIKK